MLHFLPKTFGLESHIHVAISGFQEHSCCQTRVANLASFPPFSEIHSTEVNSDLSAFISSLKKGKKYLFNVYYVPSNVVGTSHKLINEKHRP